MFDLYTQAAVARSRPQCQPGSRYCGPERRRGASQPPCWHAAMLDEIDYGMVLLSDSGQVLHVNGGSYMP